VLNNKREVLRDEIAATFIGPLAKFIFLPVCVWLFFRLIVTFPLMFIFWPCCAFFTWHMYQNSCRPETSSLPVFLFLSFTVNKVIYNFMDVPCPCSQTPNESSGSWNLKGVWLICAQYPYSKSQHVLRESCSNPSITWLTLLSSLNSPFTNPFFFNRW
jgi:hypothetical protein